MAIKATELRVGNVIGKAHEDEISEVIVTPKTIQTLFDYEADPTADEFARGLFYCPVPLTEEWLLKFGFELQNTDDEWPDWKKEEFELLTDFGDGTYEYNPTAREILYVHQLQNLYQALTGQELTARP